MKRRISIIIPVYNGATYIESLLNKLLILPESIYEIIIVDDGSIDGTKEVCKMFSSHNNLIYVYQENQGVSNARNTGISYSNGKYIVFCDADDEIDIERFKLLIEEVMKNEADYYITGYIEKNYKNNSIKEIEAIGKGFYNINDFASIFFENLKVNLISYPVNKVFLKSIIDDNNLIFDESLSFAEDLVFNLDYLKCVKRIWVSNINSYIYNKYRNENSLSSNFSMKFWKARKIVYQKLSYLLEQFDNYSHLKVHQNTYAAKVLIYTTRQIVSQNISVKLKINQLRSIFKDTYLNNFIHSELLLSKNQKILISFMKYKKAYSVFLFWRIFDLKDKLNNGK
ncbi:glycosyltransferase family 2 protein [Solibacillus sp. CAU 1738]|uniref:glycosyltransferase family 2 protein n=1 Tax=Solibacillus sp. CAU 1738 TaxID=3140363 RepID=UPI0032606ECE